MARVLAAVDLRIRPERDALEGTYDSWEARDSEAEKDFHLRVACSHFGVHVFQFLEPQRSMDSLLRPEQRRKLRERLED